MQAYESEATEILFGGASEGGKSHLLRVCLISWSLAIPGLQCALLRKKFDDIIKNHVLGPTGFEALLKPLVDKKAAEITQKGIRYANNSYTAFLHCQDERQFESAQGVERHVLAVDEATQIVERMLRSFRAWVRMPQEMKDNLPEQFKGLFPRIIYTGNPVGIAVPYFRRHFVKCRPAFKIEIVGGFKRQYIPSRAEDNESVNLEEHHARIAELGDPALISAMEGNWDAPVGDFFPEYDDIRHSTPDFIPPEHWFRYRSFDWGTADPFSVGWWAVSDGESFKDHAGRARWFPRGALIRYREWYGADPLRPADGLRMRNEDMALGILERSPAECERKLATITDSLPFQDRGGKTIAETFRDCGVILTQGDTSRIPGWSQLRARLIGKKIDANDKERTPMIFFCESCKAARDYLPALPRHKTRLEDATEDGESTHACDEIRLACMARSRAIDKEKKQPDPKNLKNEMTFEQAVVKVQRHRRAKEDGGW